MSEKIKKNIYIALGIIGCGGLIYLIGYLAAYSRWQMFLLGIVGIALTFIIFKNPFTGVLLMTFFLPFERIGSIDIGGVTIRPSQVIAVITIFAFLIGGIFRRKLNFAPNPIFWPLAGFVLVYTLAIFNAPNIERSGMVLAFIMFTCFVAILLPNLIHDKVQLRKVLNALMLTYLLVTVFGIYQFLGDIVGLPPELTGLRDLYTKDVLGFPRVQSTALEPLYFANFLLLPFCLILSVFLTKTVQVKSWILAGLVALGGLNLVLTVSRGAYIAFAASFLVIAFFLFRKVFTIRNIIFFIIIVAMVAVGSVYFLDMEGALEDFTEHTKGIFEGASYEERVNTFEIAQRAWSEHPIIGIGPGSFGPYASGHPYMVPQDGFLIVNNVYIEILAESGILGLFFFSLIIIILIIRNIRAIIRAKDKFIKAILVGLLAAFIGILVQYNTFSILYIMHIWFTIGVMIAVQNIVLRNKKIDV